MTQPRSPTAQKTRTPAPRAGPLTTREQVLARRRFTLIGLGVAMPVTLVLAIVTGSVLLLILNIAVGLALAAYVAILLQIKQAQQRGAASRPARQDEDQMTVIPPS